MAEKSAVADVNAAPSLRGTGAATGSHGAALMQVAANPYVAVIGLPESAERRRTLVQAFSTTNGRLKRRFGKSTPTAHVPETMQR